LSGIARLPPVAANPAEETARSAVAAGIGGTVLSVAAEASPAAAPLPFAEANAPGPARAAHGSIRDKAGPAAAQEPRVDVDRAAQASGAAAAASAATGREGAVAPRGADRGAAQHC
jgi:hypothetical protein